jgi:PAS domain S-box-containing protein
MPTLPFSVVHVNKAFCNISGLTHTEVIGKPIEAILKVVHDIPLEESSLSCPLKSEFLLSSSSNTNNKFCQLQVSPITDRSQNARGMTHVLIKIEPWVDADSDSTSTSNGCAVVSDLEKPATNNHEISHIDAPNVAHQVTVG